jgi:hypothetical protein
MRFGPAIRPRPFVNVFLVVQYVSIIIITSSSLRTSPPLCSLPTVDAPLRISKLTLGVLRCCKQTLHLMIDSCCTVQIYSGRKITESLGNVTVRGEKDGKGKGKARRRRVCLSMYSITENIYFSQLSSVAILLQPEPNCFTWYNTRKWLCFLSLCTIVFRSPPASHVSSSNSQWSSQLFCVHYRISCACKHRRAQL